MANLLAEGYRRLFKGKRFYICMIVYLSIALLEIIIYRIGNNMFSGAGDLLNVDTLIFSGLSLTVLMTAITGGMLIARDYTNNTIRNTDCRCAQRNKISVAGFQGSVRLRKCI